MLTSSMELNSFLIVTFSVLLLLVPVTVQGLCNSSNYNFTVPDSTPRGSVIYKVPSGFVPQSISDNAISVSFYKHFNISQSNVISVSANTSLNRNSMALTELRRSISPVVYTLKFLDLSILSQICTVTVTIYVTGLNNMAPTFTNTAKNLSILEGIGPPYSWPMDLATDNDEGINSTQNYYIDGIENPTANLPFYLNMSKDPYGAINILQLRRRMDVIIDREVTPSFNFTIVAEEGQPNALKGYQRIYINVEDVCDFVPVFQVTTYHTEVPENTTTGSVVLTVKAVDLDLVDKNGLTYSISSQCIKKTLGDPCQPAEANGPFVLDSASGNLILTQRLYFSKAQEVDLIVTATDSCNLAGTAEIHVGVTFVNDQPPNIQVFPVSNGMIKEDSTLSSDIATVIVTSTVNFSAVVIDNSTGLVSDTFYLVSSGSSFLVKLRQPLNSRIRSSYNITIKATDVGNNVAYSTVSITVLGVNHPPVFDNKTALVSVFDNTRNGTVILRVRASDDDVGGNGRVTYELPPPNATFPYQRNFTINATSGDLIVNGILDRKVAKNFMVLIKTRDNPIDGEPYFSDYMIVNITLLDPNGNRPIFSLQSPQISISENQLAGVKIFRAISYNPESVPNGTEIVYSIASNPAFQINSTSGVISIAGSLNGSANMQYALNITAYNGFPPPSFSILTINILPGDTTGPVFVPKSYNAQVMRTAAIGSRVVDVKAVDTYSSVLLYEIVNGNGEGKFILNPTNGTITVSKPLDQSAAQTYVLHVKASDRTYYSKWLAEVVINVMEFRFQSLTYNFQIQEGQLTGTVVGKISTSLSDAGQVSFKILQYSPDDSFALDPISGTITTKRALSAATGRYTLLIEATYYLTLPPTSIRQTVTINIAKQNEVLFQQPSYSTTISRSLDIGTTVLNVTATDTSAEVVSYTLVSSSHVPFQVDRNSGSIYLTEYLDSTPKSIYTFDIEAVGISGRSAVTVKVNVDLSIIFDQSQDHIIISGAATKGSVVATIRATGRRGIPIYYYFSNDAPKAYFQIDKMSGDISLLVGATTPPATLVRRQSNLVFALVLAQDSADASINATFSVALSLPTTLLQQGQINPTSSAPLTLIVGAAGGGVLVIAIAFVVIFIVLMVHRKRRAKAAIARVESSVKNSSNRNSAVLISVEPPHLPHPQIMCEAPALKPHTPQSQRAVSKDDMAEGEPVYRTSSLKTVPHARSTSDLASSIATDLLSGPEDVGPYSKAQLMAIYAANAQLLEKDGSQDSVHMFGSEGGVEVDEVDHMMFGKAMEFEEEDDISVLDEDRSSIQQPGLQEQKGSKFNSKRLCLPSTDRSQSDEMPRYDNTCSQSSSLYSQPYDEGRGFQISHMRQPHDSRATHEQEYYSAIEHSQLYRLPNERALKNIYTNAPLMRGHAKKAAYLGEGSISTHSQDLTCPDGPLPTNLNLLHHTPLSDTPTDDGSHMNASARQGAGSNYYYASSSSIASTNLSQTVP